MLTLKASKISVIIPTKNDESNIKEALNSLKKNNVFSENIEVIIVDGHSNDETVKIAATYPVKIFYEEVGTRGGACNVGWRNSSGDIIVFTDADCLFVKDWIARITKHFDDPKVAAVGGVDLTPHNTTSYFQKASGLLDELRAGSGGSYRRLRGCNVAYRKSTLVEAGGFDEQLVTCEEVELHNRLRKMSYKLVFDPSIKVYHKRRPSIIKYYRQFRNYGSGHFQMVHKHPYTLLTLTSLPVFTALMFCFSTVFSLLYKTIHPLLYVTFLLILCYLGFIMFKIVFLRRNIELLPGVFIAFMIRNIAWVHGFFSQFFSYLFNGLTKRGAR